jgi:ABC-2 type transport system permease protein
MMGNLIKAEYRKIITTKMWWALLVPSVLLAIGWSWLGGEAFSSIADGVGEALDDVNADVQLDEMSWASLALTRAMNFATLFPMTFGALAVASEINRRTITTSFLTASTRAAVLSAKAIVYVVWGLIYGVVVALGATIGTAIGADAEVLPGAGDWILILLSGILACVLWTVFGMGVGALLGSPVAALLVLLLYAGLVGPVTELIITASTEGSHIAGFMPNGSANGLTGGTASELLYQQAQDMVAASSGSAFIPDEAVDGFNNAVRFAAGAPGAFAMWVSGLIFLAWTALFFITGMSRNNNRDIT